MAWTGDVSPVGHTANVALIWPATTSGFRRGGCSPSGKGGVSGCPRLENGYFWATEAPGWGIEVDEKAAAKYPFGFGEQGERKDLNGGWGEIRRLDGTIIKQ